MAINFDAVLGLHERALTVRSQRAEVLANNIVNADTPGFKARDIDFREALRGAQSSVRLATSNSRHISTAGTAPVAVSELKYRVPTQPSIDGNSVDLQIEQAEYAKNALGFQSSFTFLNSKIRGLSAALKGE